MLRRNCGKKNSRWIDVRFPARCCCGREIRRADRGYYFPKDKTVVCKKCGLTAEAMLVNDDMNQVLKVR